MELIKFTLLVILTTQAVFEGYTKQNGFTDYISHAWSAALIDSFWFLFDPTWGSGYVNGGKFFKKMNNDYYKVSPSVLIKSHIPFDYFEAYTYVETGQKRGNVVIKIRKDK